MDTFDYVARWLEGERYLYQVGKWSYDEDVEHLREFVAACKDDDANLEKTYWFRQLDNYLYRSTILGLDNLNGRQALAKFVATAVAMLEATVVAYGALPAPGVSSGELREWEASTP